MYNITYIGIKIPVKIHPNYNAFVWLFECRRVVSI